MNPKFLLLALATGLATTACSSDKKPETTTSTTTLPATGSAATTAAPAPDTLAYRSAADALAARVAAGLRSTDTALTTRLRQVYYGRGRALRALDARYTADTAGRYAALRAANDAATARIKTLLTDPVQYRFYAENQGAYYEGPYTVAAAAPAPRPSLGARVGQGSGVKKLEHEQDGDRKVKYENSAKIKRDDDGSLKIKRADGTKIKIDADGHRTVK